MTGCWVGAALPGGIADLRAIADFEAAIGRRLAVAATYKQWAHAADFDAPAARRLLARGTAPLLTWEPWHPRRGVDQPDYRLAEIAAGRYDAYLHRWGESIRDYGGPLLLRFAHEANGDWYPWCAGVNATTAKLPGRVSPRPRRRRRSQRALGLVPQRRLPGLHQPRRALPGGRRGRRRGPGRLESGRARRLAQLRPHLQCRPCRPVPLAPGKPVIIAETGCAEVGGARAEWLALWPALRRRPAISGIVYFNIPGAVLDWRLTDTRAVAAFAGAADDDYFSATP